MTTTADQLLLPLDGLLGEGHTGPTAAALVRSIQAAAIAGRLAAKDEAAAVAALGLADAIDAARNPPLETLIRGHGALRAWYAALGLTSAGRRDDNGGHGDTPDGPPASGAWDGFGGPELHHSEIP